MGLQADFTHFHGRVYPEAYIRLTRPFGEKTKWGATFDVYYSKSAFDSSDSPESLESIGVDFDYDYSSNIYELAYSALKAKYADRLDNIKDI